MSRAWPSSLAVCLVLLAAATADAQSTNGAIQGRITDEGGLTIARAEVVISSRDTGVLRRTSTDESGLFRLAGLPVGTYDVQASASNALPYMATNVAVNVAATTTLNFRVPLGAQTEAITVTTTAPLLDARDSGISEVVTQPQVDGLPLNGRQYANLAALVPGVRLGFLFNYGKGTQFAPVVLGGTGRNVSYVIDGGQHNDDKRGGISQLFPLDAIEEFNFRQRFTADYGRATGAVLNVVTKSGTNDFRASLFAFFRDDALNARTESEKLSGLSKSDFRRYQLGGTFSGPLRHDRAHYLVSMEQILQRASSTVDNDGLDPAGEGTFELPLRETLAVAKLTSSVGEAHYASLRYAFNRNRYEFTWPAATDAGLRGTPDRPPEAWSRVSNAYHSLNANLGSVVRPGVLNELVAQYSKYANPFRDRTDNPIQITPSGFFRGQADLDIRIRQHQFQVRDDLTWRAGRHETKAGFAFTRESALDSTRFGEAPRYYHIREDLSSPVGFVSVARFLQLPAEDGLANSQYAAYAHHTARFGRLTVDAGVRYETVSLGVIDQADVPVFVELQQAGAAGRLAGMAGFADFGQAPRADRNNLSPRMGLVWDVKGDGRLLVRAGAGRYFDFAYADSTAGQAYHATVETAGDPAGLRLPGGGLFRPGDPISVLAQRTVTTQSIVVSPRLRQPSSDQVSVGASHALGDRWAIEVDALYARGRDWPLLVPNSFQDGQRRFAGILPTTGRSIWGAIVSGGRDVYKGVTIAAKSTSSSPLHLMASYTLASVRTMSGGGTDDYRRYQPLDASDPFSDAQFGPASTDARHSANVSGIWSPGGGWSVGMIFRVRSKTPYTVITGGDDNGDGAVFDLPPGAATINQARGSAFSQLDARLTRRLRLGHRTTVDFFLDTFNLFNRRNPSDYEGNLRLPAFGTPRSFAGDGSGVGEPRGGEQRQVRIGVRVHL
jgi:hypothetical protein